MTKMLAGANRKLLWIPDGGLVDYANPKVAELTAASVLDLSCLVTKANFNFGPTGDNAISDPALCAEGDSQVPGNTTYEAGMDFFRWTTTAEDKAWTTFTGKGIAGFLALRIGKDYKLPPAATDVFRIMGAITGTPRDLVPDAQGGFEKFRQEFFVQSELVKLRATVTT